MVERWKSQSLDGLGVSPPSVLELLDSCIVEDYNDWALGMGLLHDGCFCSEELIECFCTHTPHTPHTRDLSPAPS